MHGAKPLAHIYRKNELIYCNGNNRDSEHKMIRFPRCQSIKGQPIWNNYDCDWIIIPIINYIFSFRFLLWYNSLLWFCDFNYHLQICVMLFSFSDYFKLIFVWDWWHTSLIFVRMHVVFLKRVYIFTNNKSLRFFKAHSFSFFIISWKKHNA